MIGTVINNYEIVSLIGEGGMGNVYLARHHLIGRSAAVKVLHAQLAADEGLVARFINEARAANRIRHPNIIEILDAGQLPGSNRPYLMMEFLSGESLARRLARVRPLPVALAIDFARQTASALAAAHAQGIIHRDLKPENLFVVPHGSLPGREVVKVLDFGIAKLHSEIGDAKVHTQTGVLMGTPPYMSPEQCRGLSLEIDLRTDVYALGIILFEMTCGSTPFNAPGFGDLLVMHILQPPPAPRSINPRVPEALEAVILKALAKPAGERFASMADFEAALVAVPLPASTLEGLAPGPVAPAPPGSLPRAPAHSPPPAPAPAAIAALLPHHHGARSPSLHPIVSASETIVEPRAAGPETTTTFRATAGEVSSDMAELALVRTRRPLVLGGIALAGVLAAGAFALSRLPGPGRPSDPADPVAQPTTGSPASAGAPAVAPAAVTPSARSSLPPALQKYLAPAAPSAHATATASRPADAGAPARSATARPARKPPAARPPGGKGGGRPEKW